MPPCPLIPPALNLIIDRSRERMTNNVRKSIEYSYKYDKIKRRGGLIMSQFNTVSLYRSNELKENRTGDDAQPTFSK